MDATYFVNAYRVEQELLEKEAELYREIVAV